MIWGKNKMIKVKEFVKINEEELEGTITLVGMPGIANVGKLAVMSMIENLNAKKIMEIYSYDFPPHVHVTSDGFLRIPKSKLYFWKDNSQEIFFLSGDYQPSTNEGIYSFSDQITQILTNFKSKMIISLGAFALDFFPEKPAVYVSATKRETLDEFLTLGDNLKLFKGGTITGANGIIPAWGKTIYDIEGASLLAETTPLLRIDPRASKTLIEVLNNRFGLKVDLTTLDERIKEMEATFDRVRDRVDRKRRDPELPQPPLPDFYG